MEQDVATSVKVDPEQPQTRYDRILRKVAKCISYIFFPFFVPVYGVLLFFHVAVLRCQPVSFLFLNLLLAVFFAVLLPLACVYMLKKYGVITSVKMTRKEDRLVPYFCTAISMFIGAVLMYYSGMFVFVYGGLFAGAVCVIVNALVSFWWKISAHTMALGCWFGCVLNVWCTPPLSLFVDHAVDLLSLLLIMSALVASARLYFEHHTEGQVLAGFLNGVFWGYMVLYFLEPR